MLAPNSASQLESPNIAHAFQATPRNFLVSHFIDLKNTCGRVVHYPLFIINFPNFITTLQARM